MKRKFHLVLLVSIASFIITSCKKEQVTPSGFQGNNTIANNNGIGTIQTITLIADQWKKDEIGFYVHTFQNILTPPVSGKRVKVYLLTENQEKQINAFIFFMDGQLWATYTKTDVKIVFRCSGALPFTALNIKVVIE